MATSRCIVLIARTMCGLEHLRLTRRPAAPHAATAQRPRHGALRIVGVLATALLAAAVLLLVAPGATSAADPGDGQSRTRRSFP